MDQQKDIMIFHRQIIDVMSETGGVLKTGRNQAQKYNYSSETDIIGAVRASMIKHGLFLFPCETSVISDEQDGKKRFMTAIITYELRSSHSSAIMRLPIPVSAMDFSDKAPAKALTMALKYALNQLFLLMRGVDPDDDKNNLFDLKAWAKINVKGGYQGIIDYTKKWNIEAPSSWSQARIFRFIKAFQKNELPLEALHEH